MQQYTDFAGKPIKVGDTVAYATKISSSARLELRTVAEIIELVPHHRYKHVFMRHDQRHRDHPTTFYSDHSRPDKLYVVKLEGGGGQVVSKIDNLVVIR